MPYKIGFLLLSLFISLQSFVCGNESDLMLARIYFEQARNNETANNNLIQLTRDKGDNALLTAYHGAANAMMARYVWNPYKKLEYVNKGLLALNKAANIDKKEVEIRFLRLSVEENIPNPVQFTSHIQEDKKYILQNLLVSHVNYKTIRSYLLVSKSLTEEERKRL